MITAVVFLMVFLGTVYLIDQNGQLKRALDRQIAVTKLWESKSQLYKAALDSE
jgi:hypothetical protein